MCCPRPVEAREAGGAEERADLGQRHFSFRGSVLRAGQPIPTPIPAPWHAKHLLAFPMHRVKKQQLQGPFCCLRSCDSTRQPGQGLNLNSCFVCLYMRVQAPALTPHCLPQCAEETDSTGREIQRRSSRLGPRDGGREGEKRLGKKHHGACFSPG